MRPYHSRPGEIPHEVGPILRHRGRANLSHSSSSAVMVNKSTWRRKCGRILASAVSAIAFLVGGNSTVCTGAEPPCDQQPNLLFLIVDEQRYDTLAAYGNDRIQMPSLNQLATESLVFERAYCCQPVCGPSRSAILTGTWPHWNGQSENSRRMRDDVPSLPALISHGNYAKAYLGRIGHLKNGRGPVPGLDDVDVFESFSWPPIEYLREYGSTPAISDLRVNRMLLPEKLSGPKYLAERAERFLDTVEGRPFALFCSFYEPHEPYYGPLNDLHAPEDVLLPDNFNALLQPNQPLKAHLEQRWFYQYGDTSTPRPLRSEQDWRVVIARYWGLCTLVDRYVGRILQSLRDRGLYDNTLIVFTSDHGTMMGSHRMNIKNMAFEESVRVPLLVRLPRQKQSRQIASPVSQIDLVPTLLDFLGQDVPGQVQGKSLRPLIEGTGGDGVAGDVFYEWNGINALVHKDVLRDPLPGYIAEIATREQALASLADPVRSIVTDNGWKLNYSPLGEHELYDLNRDPGETHNLAGEPDYWPQMTELGLRIKRWQRATNDPVKLPDLPAHENANRR